jgi:aryl-alcohol dehydrogenase-like predicted oxidoreductase
MNYYNLDHIEKPVSRVVFGTAIKSMRNGEIPYKLLDEVYASGINVFDTAESYGDAEVALGEWIRKRKVQDKVVILTKGGSYNRWRHRVTPYDIESDFETSLAKLNVDYVDIYLLHKDDPSSPVGPLIDLLNRFHQEKRVGAIGCSNWHWRRVEEANNYARSHELIPFTIVSPNYGLAVKQDAPESEGTTLTGDANKEARDWFLRQKLPIFAYSSLGRGFFSGRISSDHPEKAGEAISPLAVKEYAHPDNLERLRRAEFLAVEKKVRLTQIAFAWLFTQPLDVFPVTSPTSIEHLHEIIGAINLVISPHEAAWLNLVIDAL